MAYHRTAVLLVQGVKPHSANKINPETDVCTSTMSVALFLIHSCLYSMLSVKIKRMKLENACTLLVLTCVVRVHLYKNYSS